MSKKIAEDLDGLVIDLKVGNGTFMKTLKEAKILGAGLKKIGKAFNIDTDIYTCFIWNYISWINNSDFIFL